MMTLLLTTSHVTTILTRAVRMVTTRRRRRCALPIASALPLPSTRCPGCASIASMLQLTPMVVLVLVPEQVLVLVQAASRRRVLATVCGSVVQDSAGPWKCSATPS